MSTTKPLLLFASFAGEGHTGPVSAIVAAMVQRGYEVVYLADPMYEDKILDLGAEFMPMVSTPDPDLGAKLGELASMPISIERGFKQLVQVFIVHLAERVNSFHNSLEKLYQRDPSRQIIIVEDILNMASQSYRQGKPLPCGMSMPKSIGISPLPLLIDSIDTAPVCFGFPPDSTESGRLRNQALSNLVKEGPMKLLADPWHAALLQSGCTSLPTRIPIDFWYTAYDTTMMLCSPSLEYPRSDQPKSIEFAGCLPPRPINSKFQLPGWWDEVLENGSQQNPKKLIFVCQGTVNFDWTQLVAPTLAALQDRNDVLVTVALGAKGASLPEDLHVPCNARVVDFIPYDLVLAHSDLFITNGGYGAFTHAVMNGVPAVLAGETEDKIEVAMRASYAGFAYNLQTQTPTVEMMKSGIDEVLGNEKYKLRALELKRENEAMD